MLIWTVAGSGLALLLVAALVALFSGSDDHGSNTPTTRTTTSSTSRAPDTATETTTDVNDKTGVEQTETVETTTEPGSP
ncbi:hypothetical protein [Mycobacterium camsae]|uniref:hypothetical protein n=1 Tax=Mycobacterium gordonae TaxID=1778 RepID=UPI001980100F|nr:hypothetical protein [Mycobacterium gordonae]